MKKLSWIISSIVAIIFIIILICYISMSTILGSILTSSFGTKTTVSATTLTFNKLSFWKLKIRNPPNAKQPNALTIGKIAITAPISTYFSKDIQINDINLNNLILTVEIFPGRNQLTNWDEIINHINQSTSGSSKSNRNTYIKTLTINNLTVKVIDANGKTRITRINRLTFRNLSTKNGDITSQIAKTIIMRMIFDVRNITKFPLKIANQTFNNFFRNLQKDTKGTFPIKNK